VICEKYVEVHSKRRRSFCAGQLKETASASRKFESTVAVHLRQERRGILRKMMTTTLAKVVNKAALGCGAQRK